MKASIRRKLTRSKRRIGRRLGPIRWAEQTEPVFSASNIRYEVAERGRGLATGGIGAMHLLARRIRPSELQNLAPARTEAPPRSTCSDQMN